MTSVLIYGGGSIGAISAYLLSSSVPEEKMVAVCRSNFQSIKENGFLINSSVWGPGLIVRPCVRSSIEYDLKNRQFDYVLVTVKTTAVDDDHLDSLSLVLGPQTAIVLMQNGIGIEKKYYQRFPNNPIISVVIYLAVSQAAPSTFTHVMHKEMQLGTFPAAAPRFHKEAAERLKDMLTKGGAAVTHDEDIQVVRWEKLIVNGSENPICALSRLRDATYFHSHPGATQSMKEVMEEIAATARAAGYLTIDDKVVERQLKFLTSRPLPGVQPSTMADALAGREMEVDALVGNTLEIAMEHGVSTPRLGMLYFLLQGLNHSFQRGG